MVGLINKEDIYDIADAIREKTQTEDTFKPSQMAGLIRSIKVVPENSYQLKELTVPTSLATFDADALPMPSLKVGIEPIQEGSGDPSPSNVRPISGHTEANVSVCGTNVWDEEWEVGSITDNGIYQPTQTIRSKNFNSIKPNTNYKIVQKNGGTPMRVCFYDKSKNFINRTTNVVSDFTTPSNCYYFKLTSTIAYGDTYNNDISVNYPSTDTEYHAYNGQTYNIQFKDGDNPLTVYGGTLDVVSGELKVVPYYASYNGETLEGEWISDRDVYAVGTTPTIGAQVVNIGATPQTYQLTPTQVKSILGSNNVWADTGNILEGEYFKAI